MNTISTDEFDDLDGWQVVSFDVWERLRETVKEREELSKSLHAAYEAIRAAMHAMLNNDLDGVVLWVRPPYQAEGVHETAWERLNSVLPEGLDNLEEKSRDLDTLGHE